MSSDTTSEPVVDERFAAYVDEEMSADERQAFEQLLEEDADLRAQLDDYRETVDVIRGLGIEFAPDDFVGNVEQKIRHRSRGRFFGRDLIYGSRIPYEVFAALMAAVMATLYLFGQPKEHDMAMSGPNDVSLSNDAGGNDAGTSTDAGAADASSDVGAVHDVALETGMAVTRPVARRGVAFDAHFAADTDLTAVQKALRATSRAIEVRSVDGGLEILCPEGDLDDVLSLLKTSGARVQQSDDIVAERPDKKTLVRVKVATD